MKKDSPFHNFILPVPYSLFIILFLSFSSSAQDFQWGQRGGGIFNQQFDEDHNVWEMATDAAGNVYTLGNASASSLQVAGNALRGVDNGVPNIVLASFTPQGQYRWAKVFGGGSGNTPSGLAAANGRVYVSGWISPADSAIFDTDTFHYHPFNGKRSPIAFLVQYDTAGAFQWLRMPGTDTFDIFNSIYEEPFWVDAAPNGDAYWLCQLRPGDLPGTPHTVQQEGSYVLRYGRGGQLLGRAKLDIQRIGPFSFTSRDHEGNFVRNHQTGDYIIGSTNKNSNGFLIGNDTIDEPMYLASFDSTGGVNWKLEGGDSGLANNNEIYDIRLDGNRNIILTGYTSKNNHFANHTFSYPTNGAAAPFVMRLNRSGNLRWTKTGAPPAVSGGKAIFSTKAELAITGDHGGLYFQGPNDLDTLKAVPNQGYDVFIARFDTATGDLLGLESAETQFGDASYGYAIAADGAGGYYLGGNYTGRMYLGPDTLIKIGSQRSFFVARYACLAPAAGFSAMLDTAINGYVFAFSGEAGDSVVWDFGDGSPTVAGDTVSHIFPALGTYTVCATGYDECGDSTVCDTVVVTKIGLGEYGTKTGRLRLAPNPANTEVNVLFDFPETNGEATLEVRDLRGALIKQVQVKNAKGQQMLKTARWGQSAYLVILKIDGEVRDYQRLVIQR